MTALKREIAMFRRKIKEKSEHQTIMDRPMWRFFGSLGDFFILTVYWVITSWPIVTIGASTTALFYVCMKLRRREEGKLWQMYMKSFKENFKQATFIWLLYIFIAVDVAIIGHMLIQQGVFALSDFAMYDGKYYPTLLIVCLVYLSIMVYTAALLAMFRQTTSQCIGGAVTLTFAKLPSTLLFLVIIWALGMATYYLFPALIFVDVPMAIYLISMRMNVIFDKQIARVEANERKESGDEMQDEITGGNEQ